MSSLAAKRATINMKRTLDALFILAVLSVAFVILNLVEQVKGVVAEAFPVSDATTIQTRSLQPKLVYKSSEKVSLTDKDKECLARNVFYEAGVEPKEGKVAVAQVTYNRLKEGKWGKTVCDVVYAKAQFSWTLSAKKKWAQPSGALWAESKAAVNEFLRGIRIEQLDAVLHYHADYVKPKWAVEDKAKVKVGQHIFYALK